MLKRSDEMRRWWSSVEPLRTLPGVKIAPSIDSFLSQMRALRPDVFTCDENNLAFLDALFDIVFDQYVHPVLTASSSLAPRPVRWMTGQLAVCEKFHFVPESRSVSASIVSKLRSFGAGDSFTMSDVDSIRSEYESFLHLLAGKNMISPDDLTTYSEVYPLFDPFFVSYDKDLDSYEELDAVSRRVLSLSTHKSKMVEAAEIRHQRQFSPAEKHFYSSMSTVVEMSGGQIQDGIFVVQPGVMLIAEMDSTEPPKPDWTATFLISGVAIETSLELVAHKEARVARLTSSKTAAMSYPLFRLQGDDVFPQRRLTEDALELRSKFEQKWNPRKRWGDGNELFNIVRPTPLSDLDHLVSH
jgi:hypothetical protein